ncbi:hypothetical protein [Fontivita pretiosa]|uniref:hypothetical protein n=1 Tax=Fontivita pretiosa TaxID=2989684 RepID=UPI003D164383
MLSLAREPFYKARRKKGKATVETAVSAPEPERTEPTPCDDRAELEESTATRHTEIQYYLLLAVVGRAQRSVAALQRRQVPGIVDELPTQFNEATNRTIELIDVL